MGAVTKEMTQASENKANYNKTEPKANGNLHERMKHLILLTKQYKNLPSPVFEAITLLENEVECYSPLPSYGQRQWIKPKRES